MHALVLLLLGDSGNLNMMTATTIILLAITLFVLVEIENYRYFNNGRKKGTRKGTTN